MTGQDIRRYRRQIGLDQISFAEKIGLSQSGLSLLETGKTSVSAEHLDRLRKAFDKARYKPRFGEFLGELENERAEGQAALAAPRGRHLTLTVWSWHEGFDLSRPPSPDQAAGLVTMTTREPRVIALEMPRSTEAWSRGEILVFEECSSDAIRDNDICLVQVRSGDRKPHATLIAMAHVSRSTRSQTLQLEPLSPPRPIFEATERIVAILRVVYRARYV